jgi:hypothetical protein
MSEFILGNGPGRFKGGGGGRVFGCANEEGFDNIVKGGGGGRVPLRVRVNGGGGGRFPLRVGGGGRLDSRVLLKDGGGLKIVFKGGGGGNKSVLELLGGEMGKFATERDCLGSNC